MSTIPSSSANGQTVRDDERERLVVERKSGRSRSRFLIDIVGSVCADERHTERLEARGGERDVLLVTLRRHDAGRPAPKRGAPFAAAGSEVE